MRPRCRWREAKLNPIRVRPQGLHYKADAGCGRLRACGFAFSACVQEIVLLRLNWPIVNPYGCRTNSNTPLIRFDTGTVGGRLLFRFALPLSGRPLLCS